MSPPTDLPRTLSTALSAHKNPPSAYATYTPYIQMTKRFLGEEPSFYPILTLSSAAIRTHVGLFARMFHAPQVDMRVPGMPSPALRRAAFVAASRAFHCTYCTAHACSFGDMLAGSVPGQVRRGQEVDGEAPSREERAVRAFAEAAVQRPISPAAREALRELAEDVRGAVGARALEVVEVVVAFAGALNTVMDVMGVELEAGCQQFATSRLKDEKGGAWAVGEYHFNPSDEAAGDFPGVDQSMVGMAGALSNVKELMMTMPAAVSSMKFEMFTLYKDIPSRPAAVKQWLVERLGSEGAGFVDNVSGVEVKRAFCFGLRENMAIPGDGESSDSAPPRKWTLQQRLRFLHLFGTVTGSQALCRDAVFVTARDSGKSVENVRLALEDYSTQQNCASTLEPAEVAACKLVAANAEALDRITPELISELTTACVPEACLELASLLSFFEMWRRIDVFFALASKE